MGRSQEQSKNWYPAPTGNAAQDDTHRIIFDNLYSLRLQNENPTEPVQQPSGITSTAFFPGGFQVGGTTYYNLTFSNGVLVGIS
jgi:hypothetical protein